MCEFLGQNVVPNVINTFVLMSSSFINLICMKSVESSWVNVCLPSLVVKSLLENLD